MASAWLSVMSSASSNMAAGPLGATFSLLLLASMTPGVQGFSVTHLRAIEALEGQSVSLSYILANTSGLKVVNIEWSKRDNPGEKLALYAPLYGEHRFNVNVSLEVVRDEAQQVIGSRLQLPPARVQDSGLYVCDVTTFPAGSLRAETQLRVQELAADSSSTDDIITPDTPPATGAPAWSTATAFSPGRTTQGTDHAAGATTERRHTRNSTPGGVSEEAQESTSVAAATDYRATLHNSTPGDDVLDAATTAVSTTRGHTSISAGSRPTPAPVESRESPEHPTEGATAEDFQTPGVRASPTARPREKGEPNTRWLLVLVVVPVLVLLTVAGMICRRRVLMKRLDQPPSFKPPPPPVKYAAVKQESIQWQTFPVSKCNSIQSQA